LEAIAQDFLNFAPTELAELGLDVLESVVSSPLLQLDSEDDFLRILLTVLDYLPADPDPMSLLSHVRMEFLSAKAVQDLTLRVFQSEITPQLWHALWRRVHQVPSECPSQCLPWPRIDRAFVRISASSTAHGKATNLLKDGVNHFWGSSCGDRSPTLKLTFPYGSVDLIGYSIEPHGHGYGTPTLWSVMGLTTRDTWVVIDNKATDELVTKKGTSYFRVEVERIAFTAIRFIWPWVRPRRISG
jgi:hypothetical protein